MEAVTSERIKIASQHLKHADIAAEVCREVGIPFFVACALLTKESGGNNVYGHDKGGIYKGLPVTAANYKKFRHFVLDLHHTSNGVGPCQITWPGFFPDMEHRGLKPWDVRDNMKYGFDLLKLHYDNSGNSWEKAGTAYNGASVYGRDLVNEIDRWKKLLNIGGN